MDDSAWCTEVSAGTHGTVSDCMEGDVVLDMCGNADGADGCATGGGGGAASRSVSWLHMIL